MHIELTASVPEALLRQVVALDHAAYPPQDQITWARARTVYGAAPDSLILLRDGETLAGYLSVFRVNRGMAEAALRAGTPIYKCPLPALLSFGDADGDLYIHNIILAPAYRGRGYRRLLFQGLAQWLETHSPGLSVWADVVTPQGGQAMGALGLKPLAADAHAWRGTAEDLRAALGFFKE